ncbi:MAG: oligosaccharide flippase family protein [Lachnospiraceae bacterium]|jgi:O-antigen/teichoic acid export membrane protein|nr:oligosaccharide flippase family protein [Lachnospiraceae bacterium]
MNEVNIKKAAIWSIICTTITSTINFMTAPIFTHILNPDEFGDVSTFNSFFIILCAIISLQLSASVSKAFCDYHEQIEQYISSIIVLALFSCLSWITIILITNPILKNGLWKSIYMVLACFTTGILNIYFISERFQYKYKFPVFITIINAISNFTLSILLIYLFPQNKANARIIGSYGCSIFFGFFATFFLWNNGKSRNCIGYWKYSLYFAVPNIVHTLGMQLLNQSDRLMIKYLESSYEVGLYSVPYSICTILNTLWSSILVVINPWLYQNLERKNFDEIFQTTQCIFKILLIMIVSFLTIIPEVMKFLIDQQYYYGISIMYPIAVGIYFSCIYTLFCTMENQYRKVAYTPVGTLSAAVINIFLNYIGIKIAGYKAAAYTSAFCYCLLAIFHGLICKKIEKVQVFPIKIYIKLSILCVCFGFILQILYPMLAVRYFFGIVSISVLAFIWKKDLAAFINFVLI